MSHAWIREGEDGDQAVPGGGRLSCKGLNLICGGQTITGKMNTKREVTGEEVSQYKQG